MTAPRTRVQRRPVHGVLLLDKPLGFSSNQALQKAKWLLRADKAGHTGTLDPLATGVLPLCFGAATKFSQQHLDANKCYSATLRLGQATATGDAEGDVVATADVPALTQADLDALAQRMTGPQQQLPPMYSALKKDGKALYEYARAGQTVEREPRHIEIYALNMLLSLDEQGFVAIHFDASCSKGTYIRTLGEDIAQALGTVGHLRALRRTRTGDFTEAGCISLAELEALDESARLQALQPLTVLLPRHTPVTLDGDNAGRFLSGLRRRTHLADTPEVAVFGTQPPALLGTAHVLGGELVPTRLLNPLEIQQMLEQISFQPDSAGKPASPVALPH
jgi:tRNA pseudouridine55 synthase